MQASVAMLTPFAFPSVRGNAVTVERIARGVRERGVTVRVWDLSGEPDARVADEVARLRPGVVHAFHAYRAGPLALRIAERHEVPLVVTLTGTDVNHDLATPDREPLVRRVLEGAAKVTAFHDSAASRLAARLPTVADRLVVVPQAVRLDGAVPFDIAAHWALPPSRCLFLFPAGIRAVKRPVFPVAPLGRVADRRPEVRLLYAGPVLDADEGRRLEGALAGRPWARHIGPVPHQQMAAVLSAADVVLNTSVSEGGMANAVLEAMALGRPVLASDIEGNRSLVEHGNTGLLFQDEGDFEAAADRLARDPALRVALGHAARERVSRLYPVSREIDGYMSVYRRVAEVVSR